MTVRAKRNRVGNRVLSPDGQRHPMMNLKVRRSIRSPLERRRLGASLAFAFRLKKNFRHNVWISHENACDDVNPLRQAPGIQQSLGPGRTGQSARPIDFSLELAVVCPQ